MIVAVVDVHSSSQLAVVLLPLERVGEFIVSPIEGLCACCGCRAGLMVRMPILQLTLPSCLDLVLGGVRRHAEHVVVGWLRHALFLRGEWFRT